MNQILVTKKLYVTPELKRKKKIYKFDFMLSIFLVLILISMYIYAEYDRNKSEQVSQEILTDIQASIAENAEDITEAQKDVLVVVLNNAQEDVNVKELKSKKNEVPEKQKYNLNGYTYYTVATISIPKINVNYSVIEGETGSEKETEELLKSSPCKFHGPEPNEVGNFCIVGHNYRNSKFFSKVPNLENGDTIDITDLTGRTITYSVYANYIVNPSQIECTDQRTNGQKEITLITCTYDSQNRVIVKAREVK